MGKAKNVEEYIKSHPKWEEQIKVLRNLLTSFPFTENIKWGTPVYTLEDKNLIGIAAFKNHISLWFYQGALLKENTALLQDARDGQTQALRQIKFEEGSALDTEVLRKYIEETIKNKRDGKTVVFKKPKEVTLPKEFNIEFEKDKDLRTYFQNLSPGKQREYAAYISEAKREETKQKRIKKIIPLIKSGKGLNDKYR